MLRTWPRLTVYRVVCTGVRGPHACLTAVPTKPRLTVYRASCMAIRGSPVCPDAVFARPRSTVWRAQCSSCVVCVVMGCRDATVYQVVCRGGLACAGVLVFGSHAVDSEFLANVGFRDGRLGGMNVVCWLGRRGAKHFCFGLIEAKSGVHCEYMRRSHFWGAASVFLGEGISKSRNVSISRKDFPRGIGL